jgi:hypothetical protein
MGTGGGVGSHLAKRNAEGRLNVSSNCKFCHGGKGKARAGEGGRVRSLFKGGQIIFLHFIVRHFADSATCHSFRLYAGTEHLWEPSRKLKFSTFFYF